MPNHPNSERLPVPPTPNQNEHLPQKDAAAEISPPDDTPASPNNATSDTPNNAEINPLAEISIFDRMRQAKPLEPGDFLGQSQNFRIVKHLGRGGMGETFLAEELEKGEPIWEVVCKIVPPEIQNLERALLAVRRTFARVNRLHHTNICPVRGLKFDDTYGWFLIMGYANGGTLTQYLARHSEWSARRGLPFDETIRILTPIAQALDYIHEEGVFHRDIKPDNVMFSINRQTRRMTVQLIDFGLSAQLQQNSLHTGSVQGNAISGTPHFMAPEQWQGKQQCRQTDQYALGVIAYRLLSRRLPFRAANIQALMAQVLGMEAAVIEGLPEYVNAAIQRALSKEPEQRFARCVDFIRTLQTVPRARPTPTPPMPQTNVDPRGPVGKTGERKVLSINDVEYAFRYCPAGTFMMGSPQSETEHHDNEIHHQVTLTHGFWMLETEVTQEMWQSVMKDTPSRFIGDKSLLPVERVSWNECQEFIQKLNEIWRTADGNPQGASPKDTDGPLKFSMPTEAQWEYACRAGTKTPFHFGNVLRGDKANCDGGYPYGTTARGTYLGKTTPVRSYSANAWGLYDMHGNVWEWCQDVYSVYPDCSETDPIGPSVGTYRVYRGGGCWDSSAGNCRAALRHWDVPSSRLNNVGLRLAIVRDTSRSE